MAQVTVEEQVQDLVNDILRAEAMEESFACFLVHSEENDKMKKDSMFESVKSFWQTVSPESKEAAMKQYVHCLHSQGNSRRGRLMLDMLESLVETNTAPSRLICESLLMSEKLTPEAAEKWVSTLRLVRKIIGGVDYKGCRDLLRLLLEKTHNLSANDNVCSLELIDTAYNLISYIMDRNTCLLPSYFAVNEITKLCADDRPWPHWKLGKLLADFQQSFRPVSQMVTVSARSNLLPVVGHSSATNNAWKLNPASLRFPLQGPLPYDKDCLEAQTPLLKYVLEQPYSRDMVCSMLCLNKQMKQRCWVLEDQLVDLVVLAMERSEQEDNENIQNANQWLWQHLSSQLIFFVLFQFASFPHMVLALYDKLKGRNLTKGRDHLMWVLLQFISGSIQKNPLEDFLPVMKLYDLLYPEKDAIPVPDVSKASSTHKMAVTCIWIHLCKKAQNDKVKLQRPIPHALQSHIEFLKHVLASKNLPMYDYKIALLCNAYSTNTDHFALPMGILVESIYGNGQNTIKLPGNINASAPTQPLPMDMLDSLTVHAKMSLIHSIVTRVIRLAQTKSNALAPALVETYSRLLVYMEIESLGIKGFISQLLPSVFKSNAWGILHTLLEMFSYRLHHIQPHYRVQLLSQLHSLASVPQTNQNQLHLCVESTALRLVMGLGSWEVQPQLSRMSTEPSSLVLLSAESEELNRGLVLTLARAMHVTGSETLSSSWCKDILTSVMRKTPHSWATHTLACFPPALREFYQQNPLQREDKQTLKRNVDMEYRKWKSMASENDLITHFSIQGSSPLFICVLWKSLLEDSRIAPTAYKVLERLGPRAITAHLRVFADYLVHEFSTSKGSTEINKCIEALTDLIWRCNVVPIERLVLVLSLRCFEGNEAQVCCFIIQVMLLKNAEFRTRVQEFVKEASPEHWLQSNWHDVHMNFHRHYPEKFYYEGLQDAQSQPSHQYLPVYFGNLCLRFLPVLDIVLHRVIELHAIPITKFLELLLDHLGGLYKFHDRPLTYLFNTLHYYEKILKDRSQIKRKLVSAIIVPLLVAGHWEHFPLSGAILSVYASRDLLLSGSLHQCVGDPLCYIAKGSLKDIKMPNWCLTDEYQTYLQRSGDDTSWEPSPEYYHKLMQRLVDTIQGTIPSPFPSCDWRFNEFPNPSAHALHATCIELMALPVPSQTIGNALLDIILKGACQIPRDTVTAWMNAIGMVLTALPEGYWMVIHSRITDMMQSPLLASPTDRNPFQMFNFTSCHQVIGEFPASYLLAMCHAIWQHASIGQMSVIPQFFRDKLKPVTTTEEQFLFVCHLVGPFLQRFHAERTRCLLELTVVLYDMLQEVDRTAAHLRYMDPVADFMYHIKYMFAGYGVNNEVEKVIRSLRPALQMRLRFIPQHGKEDAATPSTT